MQQPQFSETETIQHDAVKTSVQPMTPRRPRRQRHGCASFALLVAFLTFTLCTLCSIASLTVYLIFPPPPLDLLVVGLDARPGEGWLTRTDSIMLVGIQPRGLNASLLSIPRDVFINVPGYGSQRINTINVLGEQKVAGGGVTLLQEAIEANFGIQLDRYVRLNFQGFVALVDAVGGVTIDVPKHLIDYAYPTMTGGTQVVEFQQGVEHMDGERALIYARTRHSDDDYHRAARQQQVISALMGKLVNPLTWGPAIKTLNEYMDTDLNVWDMARYAPVMLFRAGRFDTLVMDYEYLISGGSGVVPNYQKLAPWIEERFD